MSGGFVISREIDAIPDDVFRAWTEADRLHWFFNPATPIGETVSVDRREGGAWRQFMLTPDRSYITGGIYRELRRPNRIAFVWGAVDGWPEIREDELDEGILVTIDLVGTGSATELTFRLELPDGSPVDDDELAAMREGWSETIDRLVAAAA
ncbi:SRPBCC domain-containing protein [Amnibacterium flavum]|uniref:Activator of Hsp90 ATPase homologue 1/2-like C-terminal domain-containing protein n=1 Tax=Amnibacterium flavum TaxID=2173173 RepID=A0A2V1HSF2_9MICO|nr:SRPBCC domain-containing protein [Amnibacterium flavum]PVZ94602.1 hypothetical protein DDQ50_12970 [Amnibacterium flavum]